MEREQLNFFIQKAPTGELAQLRQQIESLAEVQLIQQPTPQTLLVPVKDPINGGEFLGGEVLVTSAIARVDGNNGWAMVMDDNPELATTAAIVDGAFAAEICIDAIMRIAEMGSQTFNREKAATNQQIAGTKVSFDLL